MHGICDIWNSFRHRGVSCNKQIYLSFEYPIYGNYFIENHSSIFLDHAKEAQEEEDSEIISSFEYIYIKRNIILKYIYWLGIMFLQFLFEVTFRLDSR